MTTYAACACCGVHLPLIEGLCDTCRYYGCTADTPSVLCEGGDWPFSEAQYRALETRRVAHITHPDPADRAAEAP